MDWKIEKPKVKFARPDYFQGILQLRDINEEILDFVKRQLEKRHDAAVTKAVKFDNGIDLYVTSQQFIRATGKKLKDSFGGELKFSAKLHTRSKSGKDLYRVNALYRPFPYKIGERIMVRGEDVKIVHIGSKIFAKNMKNGKRITIRKSDLFPEMF